MVRRKLLFCFNVCVFVRDDTGKNRCLEKKNTFRGEKNLGSMEKKNNPWKKISSFFPVGLWQLFQGTYVFFQHPPVSFLNRLCCCYFLLFVSICALRRYDSRI